MKCYHGFQVWQSSCFAKTKFPPVCWCFWYCCSSPLDMSTGIYHGQNVFLWRLGCRSAVTKPSEEWCQVSIRQDGKKVKLATKAMDINATELTMPCAFQRKCWLPILLESQPLERLCHHDLQFLFASSHGRPAMREVWDELLDSHEGPRFTKKKKKRGPEWENWAVAKHSGWQFDFGDVSEKDQTPIEFKLVWNPWTCYIYMRILGEWSFAHQDTFTSSHFSTLSGFVRSWSSHRTQWPSDVGELNHSRSISLEHPVFG